MHMNPATGTPTERTTRSQYRGSTELLIVATRNSVIMTAPTYCPSGFYGSSRTRENEHRLASVQRSAPVSFFTHPALSFITTI